MGDRDPIKRIAEDVYQNLGSGYSEEVGECAVMAPLHSGAGAFLA